MDIEVAKLRLLKADYQSRHYRLEDQLLKFFPQQIEQDTQVLTGLQKDQATAMENPVPEKHFVGMEIKGKAFSDKEAAGEAILAACKLASSKDVELGHYRGFSMRLTYDSMANRMLMVLQGEMSHFVELGTDARGNILRMDNMLGGIPNRSEAVQAQLENINREAYLRRAAINCYLLSMKLPEVKEISRLLGYAGNNLNQLAHQANASGWVSQREVAALRGRFEEIVATQRALLEKLARL